MSQTYISASLRRFVHNRAQGRCEYCLIHEEDVLLPHQYDHIIAEQHGGKTDENNLALACVQCQLPKGPNIASLDVQTGLLVSLFHPRRDEWDEHFQLDHAVIHPLTSIGRVTAFLLVFNAFERVQLRQTLIHAGRYP